jgi:hypothetical protein
MLSRFISFINPWRLNPTPCRVPLCASLEKVPELAKIISVIEIASAEDMVNGSGEVEARFPTRELSLIKVMTRSSFRD